MIFPDFVCFRRVEMRRKDNSYISILMQLYKSTGSRKQCLAEVSGSASDFSVQSKTAVPLNPVNKITDFKNSKCHGFTTQKAERTRIPDWWWLRPILCRIFLGGCSLLTSSPFKALGKRNSSGKKWEETLYQSNEKKKLDAQSTYSMNLLPEHKID